ncbi:MAG: hypothetical protein DMG58_28655 [Acidobacteria bacterium]|nr:MAG: hypothetical protein DMG58_28655 [Acidobacteriota bacterium]
MDVKKAHRNDECDEIERFASELARDPHCMYNFDTKGHTLELSGRRITITMEEFQDKEWRTKFVMPPANPCMF